MKYRRTDDFLPTLGGFLYGCRPSFLSCMGLYAFGGHRDLSLCNPVTVDVPEWGSLSVDPWTALPYPAPCGDNVPVPKAAFKTGTARQP